MKSRIDPIAFRAALRAAQAVIHAGDTNGDGTIEHLELLNSPKMVAASRALHRAAELTYLSGTTRTRAPALDAKQVEEVVGTIGSDRFLDTFARRCPRGTSETRSTFRGHSKVGAGEAASALLLLARELTRENT